MWVREPSPLRAVAELSTILSVAFGAMIAGGWWLTTALSLPSGLPPPFGLLGWAVAAGAVASLTHSIRVLSVRGRGTPYPRRPPTALVTEGPYARVRNPIILSWGALLFGLALALGLSGLIVLLVPAAVVVHVYVVIHEEPILARRFGPQFEDYRRRVPRWIPRLRV